METTIKFLFLFALLAVHLPSPAEGEKNTRYINYYYKYRYYNRYSYYSVPSNRNGTACGSSCIAASVFTTIATQPCLICCFIVVAYFLCKCSCATCNSICKSSTGGRVDSIDEPVVERSRPIISIPRRDRSVRDVIMMTVVEDTPPPYSPEMEKHKRESDKVVEEKPPGYEDIYTVEAYPAQD